MAYTEEALAEKLQRLLPTQQSIQTLSHWIVYHRKRFHKQSIQVWEREIIKAAPEKRITFLYLANDVMQNSRAKGTEFLQEYSRILVPIMHKVFNEGDAETQKQIERLLVVWQDRRVLAQSIIDQMRAGFSKTARSNATVHSQSPSEELARHISSLDDRTKRVDELAEAAKAIKPEMRSGEALKSATPESYNNAHNATREALHTLEGYLRALEEDVPARESLLKALQQYTSAIEHSTAERRKELQQAQAGIGPVIATLRAALLQPPPAGMPSIEPPPAPAPAAAAHEAYTPAPASGAAAGAGLPPNVLALLSQLAPSLSQATVAQPASQADPKQPTLGWLPLQQ